MGPPNCKSSDLTTWSCCLLINCEELEKFYTRKPTTNFENLQVKIRPQAVVLLSSEPPTESEKLK